MNPETTKTAQDTSTSAPQPTDNANRGTEQHIGNPEFPHVDPERNALSQNKSGNDGW